MAAGSWCRNGGRKVGGSSEFNSMVVTAGRDVTRSTLLDSDAHHRVQLQRLQPHQGSDTNLLSVTLPAPLAKLLHFTYMQGTVTDSRVQNFSLLSPTPTDAKGIPAVRLPPISDFAITPEAFVSSQGSRDTICFSSGMVHGVVGYLPPASTFPKMGFGF